MNNIIFDKTEKGRDEIATRKHHLAAKLRPLLVMIDGKQTAESLLKKVAGLGIDETGLIELLDNGFILAHAEAVAEPPENPPPLPVEAAVISAKTPTVSPAPATSDILAEGETQIQTLHNFFNATIKSTIGLRGFALQLKVERASTVEEFRALREPYLEAVLKAKGSEMAHSLRNRLDELLNYVPPSK